MYLQSGNIQRLQAPEFLRKNNEVEGPQISHSKELVKHSTPPSFIFIFIYKYPITGSLTSQLTGENVSVWYTCGTLSFSAIEKSPNDYQEDKTTNP